MAMAPSCDSKIPDATTVLWFSPCWLHTTHAMGPDSGSAWRRDASGSSRQAASAKKASLKVHSTSCISLQRLLPGKQALVPEIPGAGQIGRLLAW